MRHNLCLTPLCAFAALVHTNEPIMLVAAVQTPTLIAHCHPHLATLTLVAHCHPHLGRSLPPSPWSLTATLTLVAHCRERSHCTSCCHTHRMHRRHATAHIATHTTTVSATTQSRKRLCSRECDRDHARHPTRCASSQHACCTRHITCRMQGIGSSCSVGTRARRAGLVRTLLEARGFCEAPRGSRAATRCGLNSDRWSRAVSIGSRREAAERAAGALGVHIRHKHLRDVIAI